jgi:uncharacterized protein (TIGR02444 family)
VASLELQDWLGLDVNLVLFAAWLGSERGRLFDRPGLEGIERMVAGWSADVVQPLRAVRRILKAVLQVSDLQVQSLRKRIAGTELFSEQVGQALLLKLVDGVGRPSLAGGGRARECRRAIRQPRRRTADSESAFGRVKQRDLCARMSLLSFVGKVVGVPTPSGSTMILALERAAV